MKTGPSINRHRMPENARPIPGFPGFFVTPNGDLYSTVCRWGKRPTPLLLKVYPDQDGYLHAYITIKGIKKACFVHRAVAKAFIRLPRKGEEVRHLDGIKTHNWFENLCYGTKLDNARDRDRHGRTAKGENGGTSVLKNADVIKIREQLKAGRLQKVIALNYGVCKGTISHIKTGRNWSWLQEQH